jgi:ubiquitin-conjugating enzyme E2 Z
MSIEKTVTLSKETIRRLLNDVKTIINTPLTDHGIYYSHDEDDIMKGYAMITGPSETPYFGGFYFFELHFPSDYPYSPPLVIYCTNGDNIRFNPNLYVNGKVCISLLNTWRGEQWTACQTISTILLNLCTLLCNNPLLNEPGITIKHTDLTKYNKIIEFKNIDIAIIQMMKKKPGIFLEKFEGFYPIMKEYFLKNKDVILSFIENKSILQEHTEFYIINIYNMNVCINWSRLLKNYKDLIKEIV